MIVKTHTSESSCVSPLKCVCVYERERLLPPVFQFSLSLSLYFNPFYCLSPCFLCFSVFVSLFSCPLLPSTIFLTSSGPSRPPPQCVQLLFNLDTYCSQCPLLYCSRLSFVLSNSNSNSFIGMTVHVLCNQRIVFYYKQNNNKKERFNNETNWGGQHKHEHTQVGINNNNLCVFLSHCVMPS